MKITASTLLCLLPFFSFAEPSSMNEDFKEWAKQQTKHLLKKGQLTGFDLDDVLPESDKGKKFEPSALEESLAFPALDPKVREIELFLQKSIKKEPIEGTEPFLQIAKTALENPEKELEMSVHSTMIPEEEKLATCQETGCYQISFTQNLQVEVTPEIKEKKKVCQGHRTYSEFFWKSDAEKWVSEQKKFLAKDSSLSSYYAGFTDQDTSLLQKYYVVAEWLHKENQPKCNFSWKETIVQPYAEKDLWKTDSPEGLSAIESNPHCKFLFSQVLEGPAIKTLKGFPVFRSVWGRNLLFSCEPNAESPCAKLRELGGVLVKRKCLKENLMNECDLWEKTYDMGGKAAHQKHLHTFQDREIWGLNGFDESYEKNKDFPIVAAVLGIFADMKREIKEQGDLNPENAKIFQGESLQCACSFLSGELFDCCKKMEGLAISAYLAKCTSEELALAEKRQTGKCHFIGSKKENLGAKTSKIFCCFPTKLSRVIQEQGREQLAIKWGKAEAPDCRGFSLDEITHLDLAAMDLSEVVEDLAIDKEDLLKKVRSTITDLQANGAKEGGLNTQTIIHKEEEKVLHANQD